MKVNPAINYTNDERTIGFTVVSTGFASVEIKPNKPAARIVDP